MLKIGWDLLWTIINLIIFYLLMKKFLIGPVTGIMEKRKALIEKQLEEARNMQDEAKGLKNEYESALHGAREESAKIICKAQKEARDLTEKAVQDANVQAAEILEKARNTASQEKKNALSGAKTEIAELAMEAARKLLAGRDKQNSMLYDQFLQEAGDRNDSI